MEKKNYAEAYDKFMKEATKSMDIKLDEHIEIDNPFRNEEESTKDKDSKIKDTTK